MIFFPAMYGTLLTAATKKRFYSSSPQIELNSNRCNWGVNLYARKAWLQGMRTMAHINVKHYGSDAPR